MSLLIIRSLTESRSSTDEMPCVNSRPKGAGERCVAGFAIDRMGEPAS